MSTGPHIPASEALALESLIAPAERGIASRILAKADGGSLTLFAFDAGQGLAEHTTPFDALAIVLDGELALTIDGAAIQANAGTIVRLPGKVRHAVAAPVAARMLLIILKDRAEA
jgi:quercetin dioxygenase-like cupin family protein